MTNLTQFQTGKTYFTRSICNHDCIFRFEILRRTAKSVWIFDPDERGRTTRRQIEVWNGVETFYPHGHYSMAAIISADKPED